MKNKFIKYLITVIVINWFGSAYGETPFKLYTRTSKGGGPSGYLHAEKKTVVTWPWEITTIVCVDPGPSPCPTSVLQSDFPSLSILECNLLNIVLGDIQAAIDLNNNSGIIDNNYQLPDNSFVHFRFVWFLNENNEQVVEIYKYN